MATVIPEARLSPEGIFSGTPASGLAMLTASLTTPLTLATRAAQTNSQPPVVTAFFAIVHKLEI